MVLLTQAEVLKSFVKLSEQINTREFYCKSNFRELLTPKSQRNTSYRVDWLSSNTIYPKLLRLGNI